jgi:N-acetylneuraminic acid mutarotase
MTPRLPRTILLTTVALLASLVVAVPSTAGDLPGSWETRTSAPATRNEGTFVPLDGQIHLMGGKKLSHQVYDPDSDSWIPGAAGMPEKLDHVQGVAVGGKIYFVGGLVTWPSTHSDNVYIYDPDTNAWTEGAPMPRPRGAGATVVHEGKIYYAGGLHNGVAVKWFDVYDPVTNTWTELPDMPREREHFHGAVVNGKLYAIGGRLVDINEFVTQTDAYDFGMGEWQTGFEPIPTPRGGFGAAVVDGQIVVMGGEGGGEAKGRVEVYDPVNDCWYQAEPMAIPRHGFQAAEVGGNVYVATGNTDQGGGSATAAHDRFVPGDLPGCGGGACTGADNSALDEDGDGYDNADEIDNGTDPCVAADVPPDVDEDFTSDRNDPDDDNDGTLDTRDPFAIDDQDGMDTTLPVDISWDGDEGGIANTGFTGLMTNLQDDYRTRFAPGNLTLGSGVLTVEEVHGGDALGSLNSQKYGFQLGVAPPAGTFTVQTRIVAPFAGLTPENAQSMGLFVGPGTQKAYAKLVITANGGRGGIQFLKETKDEVRASNKDRVRVPGPDYVDLFLTVRPAQDTVKAVYQVTTGAGVTKDKVKLGVFDVPAGWTGGANALAAGIISTSRGPGDPFPATWDFIRVYEGPAV